MIESPCNRKCEWDVESGICTGCLRTLEELRLWRKMTEEEKLRVLNRIEKEVAASVKNNKDSDL